MTRPQQIEGAAELEQVLSTIEGAQQRIFDAWRLIGRLDAAFEQIAAMEDIRKAKRLANRMRNEIKAATATATQWQARTVNDG